MTISLVFLKKYGNRNVEVNKYLTEKEIIILKIKLRGKSNE